MSHTDKDRPLWVQNSEHGLIDHDHTRGACVISDDQRERWSAWRTHYQRNCRKRVVEHYTCTKDDPYRGRSRDSQTCWISVCDCPIPDDWRREPHGPCTRRRVGCIGHTRVVHDDSIPCACDDRPSPATCFPAYVFGRYYTYGGVPSDFVRAMYHRPERARERSLLDAARRSYNADPDSLDDFDFPNRQARNSARWLYW